MDSGVWVSWLREKRSDRQRISGLNLIIWLWERIIVGLGWVGKARLVLWAQTVGTRRVVEKNSNYDELLRPTEERSGKYKASALTLRFVSGKQKPGIRSVVKGHRIIRRLSL